MSFTEAKRDAIRKYMLDKIRDGERDFIRKTSDNFEISETSVRRYIKECEEKSVLERDETTQTGWKLHTVCESIQLDCADGLEEDSIFEKYVRPHLTELGKSVQDTWYYAFTEIMNNAIEHSGAERIRFTICRDALYTEISIADNGIGIFRNIKAYMREKYGVRMDSGQAALELYKGKLTSDPERHSGEGIFFVSKMLSEFAIWSENTVYACKCGDRNRFVQSHLISYYTGLEGIGTMAVMKLANDSRLTSREVFDEFAPLEEGFIKTYIPLKEMCPLGDPVARSQARRILRRLDEFKEIVFDFRDIEFMGQGFADEVFRVFQNRCPEIRITAVNANSAVQGMIRHVTHRQ